MIEITITKRSGFGGSVREVLGTMVIANDGTGTETVGHYNFRTTNKAGAHMAAGRVLGFPRKQAGAWRLLALVMQQMYPQLRKQLRRYGNGA